MSSKTILVTGGAGYIGSHICHTLLDQGYNVTIVDDLSFGFKELVAQGAQFFQQNIRDTEALKRVFEQVKPDGVVHMAAFALVEDSMTDPLSYYRNNVDGTASVLEACQEMGVQNLVFSSTCAVYGSIEGGMVTEDRAIAPVSAYGHSKAMAEHIIQWMSMHHDLKSVMLRYFNVAGADAKRRCGLMSPRSQHIVTNACRAACGEIDGLTIMGTDYDTPDGSCVRDYIHVSDLAAIHIQALEYLFEGGQIDVFNCGYGKGYSVRDIAEGMQKVSGVAFPITEGVRRAGDPAYIVADTTKMRAALNWTPQFDDVEILLQTSLDWRKKLLARS